jgi:hypothetical protein
VFEKVDTFWTYQRRGREDLGHGIAEERQSTTRTPAPVKMTEVADGAGTSIAPTVIDFE